MKQLPHFDSANSAFLLRQLDYIKQKTYDYKYAELKARKLIPVSTECPPGANKIFWRSYQQSGLAKIIGNYADDLPRADVQGEENFANVRSLGASYGYTHQEMEAAAYANVPLTDRKANSARRSIAQLENTIAFNGDAKYNMLGLLNNPNASTVSVPADGTGSATAWSTKTTDQILRDMNLAVNSVVANTYGVEVPDTLLMPLVNFNYVQSTARSINSDTTILNFFLQNNPYVKQVEWLNELNTAGAGGTTRMVAYRKSPDVLTMEVCSDFEQLEVEHRNLEYVINCIERFAGTIIYYPMAVAYVDGT